MTIWMDRKWFGNYLLRCVDVAAMINRSYLELVSELPWEAPSPSANHIDVAKARQILDDVGW